MGMLKALISIDEKHYISSLQFYLQFNAVTKNASSMFHLKNDSFFFSLKVFILGIDLACMDFCNCYCCD